MTVNKKKGETTRSRPLFNNSKKDYFFSGWIANLGVVPCWRFFALRRAPMFLWRRARLFSVTFVLETISQLRHLQRFTLKIRSHFLPFPLRPVKRFVLLATFSPLAFANAESLFIAIGEHLELKVPDLKEFSISNHDTVSHKYRPQHKNLLLRGKRQGHAEVVVWNRTGPKQTWNVYVLSKAKHLKWMETMKALEELEITTQAQGKLVRIFGKLTGRQEWETFRELSRDLEGQKELSYINQVEAGSSLKRELLGDIYQQFLLQHADSVDCNWTDEMSPWIKCFIPNDVRARPEIKELIKEISHKHFVQFENILAAEKLVNYKLVFHLYKLEKRHQLEADMTVERAAGTLADLSRKRLIELARSDDFVLGEGRYKLSTIASPEIIIRHDKEFNVQMGSELPYQSNSHESVTTSFRFAGLKINGILSSSPLGSILDYEVELSAPAAEGAISGNKKSSSILLKNAQETTAFSLSYRNSGTEKRSLPGLGNIPVLGVLFTDTLSMQEEKVIIGNISVERL